MGAREKYVREKTDSTYPTSIHLPKLINFEKLFSSKDSTDMKFLNYIFQLSQPLFDYSNC